MGVVIGWKDTLYVRGVVMKDFTEIGTPFKIEIFMGRLNNVWKKIPESLLRG